MIEASKNRLPRGWELAELRDLFEKLQYGYTASAISDSAATRFLRITDIQSGSVNWTTVPGCAIDDAVRSRYLLADGDFVFARTGSIEKAWRVKKPPLAVFASYLIRGRLCDSRLGDWIRYFVESSDYVGQAVQASAGVGRPNINAQNLGRFQIRIPPLPEQRRIIAILESLFPKLNAAVKALERVRANLKRYRASVLKAAVEGRLVPTEAGLARDEGRDFEPASVLLDRILAERRRRWEESELARMKATGKPPKDDRWKSKYKEPVAPDTSTLTQLPAGWCWATIEQLSVLVTDGDHNPPKRISEGLAHLTAKNIRNLRLEVEGCSYISRSDACRVFRRYHPEPGDLIITCVGTVGRTAIVPEAFAFSPDRNLAAVRFCGVGPRGDYVQFFIEAPATQVALISASGSTAQPHLYLGGLRRLPIALPPGVEQRRIVAAIEELYSVAESAERTVKGDLRRSTRLRQAILKWAFEGKLVGQDPDDEPASVLLERIRAERAASTPAAKSRKTNAHQIEAGK